MGTDNFAFINSDKYFKSYEINDDHYEILKNAMMKAGMWNQKLNYRGKEETFENFYIHYFNNRKWDGSCFGMVAAVALCRLGKLDLIGNFGTTSTSNVYDVSFSSDLQSAINYYQAVQYIPQVGSWRCGISGNKADNTLGNVFSQIPDAIDTIGLVPFLYIYIDSKGQEVGHYLLLYKYSVSSDGEYTIYAYNPNSISVDQIKLDGTYKVDSQAVIEAYIPNYHNKTIHTAFSIFDTFDLDSAYNDFDQWRTDFDYLLNDDEVYSFDNTYLMVRLNGDFVIENAEREKLIYSAGEFSGDMEIISENPIVSSPDVAMQTMIEVRNSDSFKLTTENDESELIVLNREIYSVGKGSDIHEIIIESNGEVALSGDSMEYEITTFVSKKGAEMFTVSGKAESHMFVESASNEWSINGIKGDCVITTYTGGVAEDKVVTEERLNSFGSVQAALIEQSQSNFQ